MLYGRLVRSAPASGMRLVPVDLRAPVPPGLQDAQARIVTEAREHRGHVVDLLGSGPTQLGDPIDWHRDFKSTHRWPALFYLDVPITNLDDSSDPKVVWELSRGHHLLTMARAARLTSDAELASEVHEQLLAWIADNPPGIGINWVNAMEVALRATNWIWTLSTLGEDFPMPTATEAAVSRALAAHGRHIAHNLEGSPDLRSNHYLCDILGLLVLGYALPGDSAAGRWWRLAKRRFEREIVAQVHQDGSAFEASTAYHGLVLEVFLLAYWLAGVAGDPFGERYRSRLEAMVEFSRSVRHANGRMPQFGDNDSGRVLPSGWARPLTQDNLVWLGAAVLDRPAGLPTPAHEDVAWIIGTAAWERLDARHGVPVARRASFPDGGIWVMSRGGTRVTVRAGHVGQNGNGGHAHNDAGAFELSVGEDPVVVDRGTFVYTADPMQRNAFRCTASHNVTQIDDLETNPIEASRLFGLTQRSFPEVTVDDAADPTEVTVRYAVEDQRSGPASFTVTRTLRLGAPGALHGTDIVSGEGVHHLQTRLHLAPGIAATLEADDAVSIEGPNSASTLRFAVEPTEPTVRIEHGSVSDRYGHRDDAAVVVASALTRLPARVSFTLSPIAKASRRQRHS